MTQEAGGMMNRMLHGRFKDVRHIAYIMMMIAFIITLGEIM